MYEALREAEEVFEQAEQTIAMAIDERLIMTVQEEMLQKAHTPLVELQALQHNVSLVEIQNKAEESLELSRQTQASAEEALEELDTRRLGMIIALVFIVLTIVALVLIKLELDRDLAAQRAKQRDEAS